MGSAGVDVVEESTEDVEDVELVILVAVVLVVVVMMVRGTCTIMFGVRMCVSEALVPVTSIVKFPEKAAALAVTVMIEVAMPFEIGVTGEPMETLIPAGALPSHDAVNATAELNPFRDLIVIVIDLFPP